MYEENKEISKAIAQIEEVQKSNPGNQDVIKRLEDLRAKRSGATVPTKEGRPEPVEGAPTR